MNTPSTFLTKSEALYSVRERRGSAKRRSLIVAAVQSGASASEVGSTFGIGHERVRQIWVEDTGTSLPRPTPAERLAQQYRVDASGCWLWTGTFYTQFGKPTYGSFMLDGKRMGAHRASYILHVGPIPDGLDILHSCDVKACVNPDHLSPGTHRQNIADARTRHGEWSPYGENHGRARLTWAKVDAIRSAAAAGAAQADLAAQYGVTQAHISHIVHGKRWNVRSRAEAVA